MGLNAASLPEESLGNHQLSPGANQHDKIAAIGQKIKNQHQNFFTLSSPGFHRPGLKAE
jgi:hypothetical protein